MCDDYYECVTITRNEVTMNEVSMNEVSMNEVTIIMNCYNFGMRLFGS